MNEHPESQHNLFQRRTFLAAAAALPAALFADRYAFGQSPAAAGETSPTGVSPGLILREKDPENLEYPFSRLDGAITPNEAFYVRNHFAMPEIDPKSWRLKLEGAVDKSLEFSLDELRGIKSETRQVTLECAGNGRVFLVPKKDGAQWELGGASNATWTGVPLSALLERAGVKSSAVELIFEGVDQGTVEKPSKPQGQFHYARSVPMQKVKAGDLLLAYEMNSEPLPKAHGYPLRLIVPGWYGMASVKWLSRIIAVEKPFHGYFQGNEYAYWVYVDGVPEKIPVADVMLKSQIARPAMHEVVAKGKPYRVTGAAWVADANIAKVEVSTDGGATYVEAKLAGTPVKNAWRLWDYAWAVPDRPGQVTLKCRATDDRGRVQPVERNHDFESYMIHHILPIDVLIK